MRLTPESTANASWRQYESGLNSLVHDIHSGICFPLTDFARPLYGYLILFTTAKPPFGHRDIPKTQSEYGKHLGWVLLR